MTDKIEFSLFSGGAYLLVQCALLVLFYGFGLPLPWWVVWFPSLLVAGVAVGGLLILVLFILMAAVMG